MLGLDGPNKDMRVLRWMVGDRDLSFAGKSINRKELCGCDNI